MPKRNAEARGTGAPAEVEAIRDGVRLLMESLDSSGRKIGNAKHGVYAFYDYDGEPIYVGQTEERLRTRIGRHLTNQRTDAVAMNVLDPFEVAEIEVWPLFDLQTSGLSALEIKVLLNAMEYTVYTNAVTQSVFGAVLNEKDIAPTTPVELPTSYRERIIPDWMYESRKHADVRIARRAATIANLARVISEREVSKGLRRTLVTQAKRLEYLAEQRLRDIPGGFPTEMPGEETGEG